jgi:hypothetical protein
MVFSGFDLLFHLGIKRWENFGRNRGGAERMSFAGMQKVSPKMSIPYGYAMQKRQPPQQQIQPKAPITRAMLQEKAEEVIRAYGSARESMEQELIKLCEFHLDDLMSGRLPDEAALGG